MGNMNGSNDYNNRFSKLKTSKFAKLLDKGKTDLGVNILSNKENIALQCTFEIIKRLSVTNTVLVDYFPDCVNKPTTLFKMMELIFACPYRHVSYYSELLSYNSYLSRKILDSLVGYGYVSVIERPRKLMLLNVYTMDDTYLVTKKGRSVIYGVYESVGIM